MLMGYFTLLQLPSSRSLTALECYQLFKATGRGLTDWGNWTSVLLLPIIDRYYVLYSIQGIGMASHVTIDCSGVVSPGYIHY